MMPVPTPMSQFRRLDPERIIATLEQLVRRIRGRFPDAGLGNVCEELLQVAQDTAERSRSIQRPHWPARLIVVLVVVAILDLIYQFGPSGVRNRLGGEVDLTELVTTLEAFLGACFFLGAAIALLVSLENRLKRRRAMGAIFEMRAMAHIVDMHQLTKDPERMLRPGGDTRDSPQRPRMTRFELSRYFDYCSEMLSLMGKVAALYVQDFPDSTATQAVDEVEQLTTSLSRKIWQKIMVLDQVSGFGTGVLATGAGDYPCTDPSLSGAAPALPTDGGPVADPDAAFYPGTPAPPPDNCGDPDARNGP